MTSVIHKGQANFLEVSADLTAAAFNNFGNGATYVGTGLMIIPGGQPLGGALIGIGSASSSIGTGINMGLNAANGEWGQFANNGIALGLSLGVTGGLKNVVLNNNERLFLRGFSDTQISIFSNTITNGIEKRKK